MTASSSSSCRARDPSSLLLTPWPWLAVAPIASPPDFTSAWERKVGAWEGPRGLRGPPPGRAAASHRLCHLHLHGEGRACWGAGGSVGGRSGASIGGCWEREGWSTPSIGLQGAWAVGRGLRGLISLSVWSPWSMAPTPVQFSQHAGQRIYFSIQTSWAQAPSVWGEPLGMELGTLRCSMGAHPGWPPIL